LTISAATNDWPVVCLAASIHGSIERLSNYLCCHEGQKGVYAVNLTSYQTILDINGDTLLISALAVKRMTSTAVVEQLIRSGR
jgi:hypothetical protein